MGTKTRLVLGQNFNLCEERLYETVAGVPVKKMWSLGSFLTVPRISLALLNYQVFQTFPNLNVDRFGKGRWDYRESFKTGVKELAFFIEMQCQSPLEVFQQGGWFWILLLWRREGRWLNQSFPTVCQKEWCQGRRCLWKVKVSTPAGAWDARFHQELLLLLTFPLVVAANSDFCMDLVHHSNFPVLGLCLKPALQLLNGEKESDKVSSYPQEQLREVLVFSNIQVKALNCPAHMRGKI